MSHFYGSLQGNRKERTCCGDKKSGVSGHIRGWNVGARVQVEYDADKDEDSVEIFLTGGSSGGRAKSLGKFFKRDLDGIIS
jgi:hypothetical protein